METEFDILHHNADHLIRGEEDLLPVESQHDKSEAGEVSIPAQVSQPLFAASMVLLTVTLDDESIADQQVHPFEIGERDAHLRDRDAPRPSKENPDHTLRAGLRAIVNQGDEGSAGDGQSERHLLQFKTRGV